MKIAIVSLIFFITLPIALCGQGITKSTISGKIIDDSGESLPGANIVVEHTESGSIYGGTSDLSGKFRIVNLRPGGPYKVTISFVGHESYVNSNIELQLGKNFQLNAILSQQKNVITDVKVTIQKDYIFESNRSGAESNISREKIEALPNLSGSIADFVRITPQANISEGNDGFEISVAGQNNRYNAIYVDGGINNDVFGLSSSGFDGGQTGSNPFALDELDHITVSVAPFDVRQSGFVGGAINAITKSGTNNFDGSAYYYWRGDNISGKIASRNEKERVKLPEFDAKKYGLSLSGKIIKNTLFFYTTYEREEIETPNPFTISQYIGNSKEKDLEKLKNFVKKRYNYDIGSYNESVGTLKSDKFVVKIDWNVNEENKLSLKYKFNQNVNLDARSSNNGSINFLKGSEYFVNKTYYAALEWGFNINSKLSNNLLISYKNVNDDRDQYGSPFPLVSLDDGSGTINFGGEQFSSANLLKQKIFTLTNDFKWFFGNHNFTFGAHLEHYNILNLFIPTNFGIYTYRDNTNKTGIEEFLEGKSTAEFFRVYSLKDNAIGDNAINSAAKFNVIQPAFYIQDDYQLTDNFRLTLGLRGDIPIFDDTRENKDFNDRTIPLLEKAGKNLQGASIGKFINSEIHWSPRLGFNVNLRPESELKSQLRGGTGIFTSRAPLVWAGGAFNNTGNVLGAVFLNNAKFIGDINNQYTNPGAPKYSGSVDLFAENFKLPQRWRTNLGLDQELPYKFVFSLDYIYDDVINEIFYENLNISTPIGKLTGTGDNRPRYDRKNTIDKTYDRIILGSNTHEGHSHTFSMVLSKSLKNFDGSISYTCNESRGIFDGTSSINSSQWRNILTVNGKNMNPQVRRSSFALGNRFNATGSYRYFWTKNIKTTISAFYEGKTGNPYSFIYREGADVLNDDSRDNALIYVPKNKNDIILAEGKNGLTADKQWEILDKFISNDSYLNSRRGMYVEPNSHRLPWSHVIDLRVLQDIYLGKKNLQFSLDIFNFTNLLNSKWGRRPRFNFNEYGLIDTESVQETSPGSNLYKPTFSINPDRVSKKSIEDFDNAGIQSSVWQIQFGLHYRFK